METNVDQLPSDLAEFLAQMSAGRQPPTRARYARVLAHLERFTAEVDLDLVSLHLGTDCAALLGAERDFGRSGSFWRVLGYDELVCLLPVFVDREWLLPRPTDARTQLSLSAKLLSLDDAQPRHHRPAGVRLRLLGSRVRREGRA